MASSSNLSVRIRLDANRSPESALYTNCSCSGEALFGLVMGCDHTPSSRAGKRLGFSPWCPTLVASGITVTKKNTHSLRTYYVLDSWLDAGRKVQKMVPVSEL